jgi:hypothetical protein
MIHAHALGDKGRSPYGSGYQEQKIRFVDVCLFQAH